MKTAIFYRSFNHGTEMYAKWLAEALHADLFSYSWSNKGNFEGYDRVIVMSGVYMFRFMPLKGFLIKNWNQLKNKEVIAISCGAAPMETQFTINVHKRIPKNIRDHIKLLTLQGAVPGAKGEKQAREIRKENVDKLLEKIAA